jgi:Protein of unknown function (DUF3515)
VNHHVGRDDVTAIRSSQNGGIVSRSDQCCGRRGQSREDPGKRGYLADLTQALGLRHGSHASLNAMKSTLALAAVAVVAVGLLTGCSPTVALSPAASATSAKCAGVVVLLPDTVSTLPQRQTNAQGTGAWGQPPDIILHCGVPVPDPTSSLPCVTVDGIDWLRNDKQAPVYTFTTYGRDPAVAVTINARNVKADGNAALSDLAIAVAEIPSHHHCVAVETLQDGEPVSEPTPTPKPTATPSGTATPSASRKP